MLIGVDLDNTIVCYDSLFHAAAVDGGLIPRDVPADKEQVRNYLQNRGAEKRWTELQGRVYGVWIERASPFSGALEFFAACKQRAIDVCIISHRTLWPCLGPPVDLHGAAREWLQKRQFHDPNRGGLPTDRVHLEETQDQKLQRIVQVGCTHFIDDLPEFLGRLDFPTGVQRILFDPHGRHQLDCGVLRTKSWSETLTLIE